MKLNNKITIRIFSDEKENLERIAKNSNQNLSDFLRDKIINIIQKEVL